ncbi:MAG: metal ABC transporter permease [Candidatus Aureabacteria bacterium]|nr:metal ABC transporter permease [Candidatus Auribacterota bacterium]
MSEAARFFIIQITFLSVVLILHTYLGLHIIKRTLIFSDLVLDQLAAFGALIGIALGIQYGTTGSYFVSMIAVIIGALLLAFINPRNRLIPREAIIGIMYALALVACLLLADKLSGGSAHITKTLTGSMLWVRWPIVIVTIIVYIVLLLFHYIFRRKFIGLTGNNSYSKKEKFWDFLFFTTQGIITVLVVPIAGVLLAYAFLMIPAAIALLFTNKWVPSLILGWSLGLIACLIGLVCSFNFDFPYGPSLILSLGLFFILAIIIRVFLPQKVFIKKERI